VFVVMVNGIPTNFLRAHQVPWHGIRGRFLVGCVVFGGGEEAGAGDGCGAMCLRTWVSLYLLRTSCMRCWSAVAFVWRCFSSLWKSWVQNSGRGVDFFCGRRFRVLAYSVDRGCRDCIWDCTSLSVMGA
jgi:hypothetical protein